NTMDKLMAGEEIPSRLKPAPTAAGAETGYDEVRAVTPGGGANAPADGPTDRDYAVSDVRAAGPVPIPTPPFWGSRVVKGIPLRDIFPFVNETALFRGQWQYQKGQRSDAEYAAFVDAEVRPVFRGLQEEAIRDNLLVPQVLYGYFP